MKKYPLAIWQGRAGAGYSAEKPNPHFLIMMDPGPRALGVFLTQAMGMDGSGSLLRLAFPFQTLTPSGAEFWVQLGRDIM